MHSYKMNNVILGSKLEDAIKHIFSSSGYHVEPHLTTQPGVDVKAVSGPRKIVCEALNWKGGFIHPLRLRSIINNLIQDPGAEGYLVCFGTSPTKQQFRILKGVGIKVRVYEKQLTELNKGILKFLRQGLGVITSTLPEPENPLPQIPKEPKSKMGLNPSIVPPQTAWLIRALPTLKNLLRTGRWIQTDRVPQ